MAKQVSEQLRVTHIGAHVFSLPPGFPVLLAFPRVKVTPLTRTDIGRFQNNGTGMEWDIPVQRPLNIVSTSVQCPFVLRFS